MTRRLAAYRDLFVQAVGDDGHKVGECDEEQASQGDLDAPLSEHSLGELAASKEDDAVDVVHDEHQRGGEEGEGHGAHALDDAREEHARRGQEKDKQLELNDPPVLRTQTDLIFNDN